MRRLALGILVVIAVLALTTSALAKKPGQPGPPATTTTTTAAATELDACEILDLDRDKPMAERDDTITLAIHGSGQASFECLWTPDEAAGTSIATVAITDIGGAVRGLPTVFVRDDSPGDICLLESTWLDDEGNPQAGPPYTAVFPLAYGYDLPDGYEAWEGTTYWNLLYDQDGLPTAPIVGAYWCAPQDPVLESLRTDTNGAPLHFMVSFNARSGGYVVVELAP